VGTDNSTGRAREIERRRRQLESHRWLALVLALAGALIVVASVVSPFASWERDDDAAEVSPPGALPDEVTTYDIGGGPSPEFVSIRGEVFAVPRDTSDPWWVNALNPGSTLGAALVAAGAVWYQTNKGRTGLERRLAELEDQVRAAGGGGSA
jgi:hypothetical protein